MKGANNQEQTNNIGTITKDTKKTTEARVKEVKAVEAADQYPQKLELLCWNPDEGGEEEAYKPNQHPQGDGRGAKGNHGPDCEFQDPHKEEAVGNKHRNQTRDQATTRANSATCRRKTHLDCHLKERETPLGQRNAP